MTEDTVEIEVSLSDTRVVVVCVLRDGVVGEGQVTWDEGQLVEGVALVGVCGDVSGSVYQWHVSIQPESASLNEGLIVVCEHRLQVEFSQLVIEGIHAHGLGAGVAVGQIHKQHVALEVAQH